MTASEPDRLDRLTRAVDAFLERGEVEGGDTELLAKHAELRDLLEPMLASEAPIREEELRLGGYRILREIGRGGMGVVYEALDLALDRHVALKVLPPHLTLSAERIARFRREANALANLSHQNIVKVHATGTDRGTHFFAMELVEGVPIAPGPAAALVPALALVADALQHAHDRGLVHRDLKPANILLRRDGTPVLTDFGLVHSEDLPSMTRSGEFAGTPDYMSPEQVRGEPVDARSDIFSFGVTLYELLTGERPFAASSSAGVLERIQHDDPVEPGRVNSRLAPDLCAIMAKALEKQPAARYPNAGALAADLRAFLEYRPVQARAASRSRRLLRLVRREPWKAALLVVIAAGVPTLASLFGFLLASERAIAVGKRTLEMDAREQLLADGWSELVNGDPARSDQLFAALLERDALHVDAGAGHALALRRLGRAAEGLAYLDDRIRRGGADPVLLRVQLWVLEGAGRSAEAKALSDRLGDPKTAGDLFVAACQEFTTNPTASQEIYRKAADLMARAILCSDRPRPLFFQQWAGIGFALQDKVILRRCVEAMKALWPESARTWLTAGRAMLTTNPEGAAAALSEAVRIDPSFEQGHVFLGMAKESLDSLDEAERSYRKAIEILPYSIAGYALGELLIRRERCEEAIAVLRPTCERRRDFVPGRVALAKALLGTGRRQEAVTVLEAAEKLQKEPELALEIADLLARARG